jgi:hypothetical protein
MASSDALVYVESVDANSMSSESPLEHLRKGEALMSERGHPAESLVRTASGQVRTPPEFSDVAFDASMRWGRAAVARCVEGSRWGIPDGADYVAHHWFLAPAIDPQNFSRLEMPPWAFACVSDAGDNEGTRARPVAAYGNVRDIRLSPDGRSVLTMQFCRDQLELCALFAYDLHTSEQRLVTRLGTGAEHGDLSVSPDGQFVLVSNPGATLVDLRTGDWAGLGKEYRAATWYPVAGPSSVLAVAGGDDDPPWRLVTIDLSTFSVELLAELPRRADGLQVARDGTIAARMRPEGETGWFDELVVSTDDGRSFEPVAPLYGASGCTCHNTESPWCPGTSYTFLTPNGAHQRRGNYATRVVRPAADGWYPAHEGSSPRPKWPVLVNAETLWPGAPVPPWPPATPGEEYVPPSGRGVARLVAREGFGRCKTSGRSIELRLARRNAH